MNSVNLIGNISTDIDLKATPTGKFVAQFNLAVNNPFNREKTAFLPIEVWGKVAENTSNFCKKGSKVSVSGHIEVDEWQKDGQKRYKTKIVASQVGFLSTKESNTGQQNPTPFQGNQVSDEDLPF